MVRVAALTEPSRIVLEDRRLPAPAPTEVILEVDAAGIGGTDVRIFRGVLSAKLPLVPGQEFSGVVKAVGSDVHRFRAGDRVSVEPVRRDGNCTYCRLGQYTLCQNMALLGVHADGGLAEQVLLPEYMLHPLPNEVSFEAGALVAPVAVALYAVRRAQPGLGASFVIIGAGPIGLSAIQLAKASGASIITVSEPSGPKRELAHRLGSSFEVDPSESDMLSKALETTTGEGYDIVLEASGSPGTLEQAFTLARKSATVVIAGAFAQPETIAVPNIVRKDLSVFGAWLYPHHYRKALQLVSAGKVNVASYVSERIGLDGAQRGFELAQQPGIVKIIVTP